MNRFLYIHVYTCILNRFSEYSYQLHNILTKSVLIKNNLFARLKYSYSQNLHLLEQNNEILIFFSFIPSLRVMIRKGMENVNAYESNAFVLFLLSY